MIRPARGSLAWRLYAIGVVQLALLAAVFMGVGWLVNGAPASEPRGLHGELHPPPPEGSPPDGPPPDGPPARGEPPEGLPPPRGEHGPPFRHVSPFTTLFVGGLLILGIGSVLTARSIVKPLGELSRAARALGAGDLRARSGLTRRDELGELARTFDEMGDRIERLLLAEKELLANVSHELRTPLARIRVALELADEQGPDAERLSVKEIASDLSELETLIDDILTTTRLEITRGSSTPAAFEIHKEESRPEALCARSAERLRARHPGRTLQIDVEAGLPTVDADPVLFRRVLDNLLENAHKYSPDGASTISLRALRSPSGVVFEVEDNGMGIAPEDLPRLFTAFFRADRSRTRGTGGVGLGLTLAKRIVEAHGGTIDVGSVLGAGTTVRVVLPASRGYA